MNGTVAPSSSSATAAATCASRTPSSFAISRSMEVVTHAPVAMERLRGRADHSGPLPGVHMDVGSADSSTPNPDISHYQLAIGHLKRQTGPPASLTHQVADG